jgi:hypothetical protein
MERLQQIHLVSTKLSKLVHFVVGKIKILVTVYLIQLLVFLPFRLELHPVLKVGNFLFKNFDI